MWRVCVGGWCVVQASDVGVYSFAVGGNLDNIFVKRSTPTVCLAHKGINPLGYCHITADFSKTRKIIQKVF